MVKQMSPVSVELTWGNETYKTISEKDGFFHFEWKPAETLKPGNYKVCVSINNDSTKISTLQVEGEVIIPSPASFTYISDIDDTFLISHSSNLRKRLFVLLTENPRSRRPFDGVVNHYKMLHGSNSQEESYNAFFYVSSSEWNLYSYIREFVREHKLPEGVFLLNQMKTFSKLFATGQGNHNGKFTRIIRIIEAYPNQKFVLLGDDSQKDIDIYSSVAAHFPGNIYCIYIRRVNNNPKPCILQKQQEIEKNGVMFCYFAHSEEAILHSISIGLISNPAVI